MKEFMFCGFVLVLMSLADAGSGQYAPIAKDAYPYRRPGLPVFPTPVRRTVSNSRIVRKVKPGSPKKGGFIPLYPNGKPTPVRDLKLKTIPASGPVSALSPRNQKIRNLTDPVPTVGTIPFHSLYQDPQ
ncbi:MAG TPA: hypothetical protein VK859_03155 [bacterium]|jgi:hypothetical protein|nr:hypothetical protein [bacterium]